MSIERGSSYKHWNLKQDKKNNSQFVKICEACVFLTGKFKDVQSYFDWIVKITTPTIINGIMSAIDIACPPFSNDDLEKLKKIMKEKKNGIYTLWEILEQARPKRP